MNPLKVFRKISHKPTNTNPKTGFEVTFVASDLVQDEKILSEEVLFQHFLKQDKNGSLLLENFQIDTLKNLVKLLKYLFGEIVEVPERLDRQALLDFTVYKENCISESILERTYKDWIHSSARENNMDEYGMLLSIIAYVRRNISLKYLYIIIENKHNC